MNSQEKLARAKDSPNYLVSVGDDSTLVLRAVRTTNPDPGDVERLTEWRSRTPSAFLTEFQATPERTEKWLRDTVTKDDTRILFMVCVADGTPVGYIGMSGIDWERRYGELDSAVRGEPGHPGAMSLAAHTLLGWARWTLELTQFGVRVFADNPAVLFYERLGAFEIRRSPLERVATPDGAEWREIASSGVVKPETRWLLHMEFPPST
jgi:RimJ/RimL family protein N-acetyltransferase